MTLYDLLKEGGAAAFLFLTVTQIAPIQINPWTAIARWVGRAFNAEIIETIDKNEATGARRRILRFDDEIRMGVKHSEDHFNEIIEDIDTYEHYCDTHPDYENHKGEAARGNVLETYKRCKDNHSFLV